MTSVRLGEAGASMAPAALEAWARRALIAVPFLWLAGYLWPPINHDAGAVLDFSRRWLAGERLYVDLIDINTPLTFAHYAAPVLLGDLLGLRTPTALVVWFALVIAASAWACARALARPQVIEPSRELTRFAVLLAVLLGFTVVVTDEFAQREHLMVVLALPYVMLSAERADGGRPPLALAALAALAAAAGFAMKPHFIGMPVLVELYVLWRRGLLRTLADPTPWIIGGTFLLHLVVILAVTPAYLDFVVPLAMEYYIGLGQGSAFAVAISAMTGPTIVALALLVVPVLRGFGGRLGPALFFFAVGGVLSDLAQGKGWPYHAYPALMATTVLFVLIVATVIERHLAPRAAPWRTTVVCAVLGGLVLFNVAAYSDPFWKQKKYAASDVAWLTKIVKRYAKRGSILVLSPGIYPHYPMVNYARARMTMPFMTMWLLQGVYHECEPGRARYHEPAKMDAAERYIYDAIPASLVKWKPGVIIVDNDAGIPWCEDSGGFDFLDYFKRHPVFAEALKDYKLVVESGRYDIYARQGGP